MIKADVNLWKQLITSHKLITHLWTTRLVSKLSSYCWWWKTCLSFRLTKISALFKKVSTPLNSPFIHASYLCKEYTICITKLINYTQTMIFYLVCYCNAICERGKIENKQLLKVTQIVVFDAYVEHKYSPGIISKDILYYCFMISQRKIPNKFVMIQNVKNNISFPSRRPCCPRFRQKTSETCSEEWKRRISSPKFTRRAAGSYSGGFTTNGEIFTTIDGPAINLGAKFVQTYFRTLHIWGVYNCFTE